MMNEFRRVFCSLRCWALLLILLLVSVFLMIHGDTHSTGFYKVYQKELASVEGRPTDEILENLRKTEESLRAETDPSKGPDLRLEAVSALIGQLEYMTYYQNYLDTVHRNAEEMSSMSIFHDDEDPFEQRNIEKTDRDFPETVALSLGNDYPDLHCSYFFCLSYCLFWKSGKQDCGPWFTAHETGGSFYARSASEFLQQLLCWERLSCLVDI